MEPLQPGRRASSPTSAPPQQEQEQEQQQQGQQEQQQQQQQQPPPPLQPYAPQPNPPHHALAHIPPSASLPLRTNTSTPVSSPGLFSPSGSRPLVGPPTSVSGSNSPAPESMASYLHPLQDYKVRETNKALIDSDNITGRKLINQYEVIEEIGRGMHGKVKLARNAETGENVAIKIIPRFSKKRRLGKVTAMNQQDKTKKEIAILKKIRHPNVVALLEVIDDPELKKIYMVLEHAELGEVVWRKKGLPHICQYERRRVEREMRGEPRTTEEEKYEQLLEQRRSLREWKRARMAKNFAGASDYWSVEHGAADEPASSYGQQSRIASREDFAVGSDGPASYPGSRQPSRAPSLAHSRAPSRGPSRSQSAVSMSTNAPSELLEEVHWDDDDDLVDDDVLDTPGPLRSNPNSATALDGTMYGPYIDETAVRGRSTSMADSIISHMSSIDYYPNTHDAFADDYSYVPCFTIDQARSTFRDTVLGLEYLHYQGVVHRDIKPANLLWSKDHRVKISDFGVSYFGRPIREGEPDEPVSESEAKDFDDDVELSKTVGTPAFFAPELCYTDVAAGEQPKVSEQIDVWSLGVTLYCLIYARIPFLAEDEFQMFRKIATEDAYIPRRRLRPVDPSTSPTTTSLYKRHNNRPYRNDNDLEYEDVDGLLYDLLRQMLTKNPEQRIKLRDIKRHPWVIQGVANPIGWLDDTDPARPSSGRRIEVNDRDVDDAVVPLTFLERARSVMRKAVGKVIHPLVDRGSEPSRTTTRRRAASSVASSAADSMANGPASTHHGRGDRRRSLLPDDPSLALALAQRTPSREPLATPTLVDKLALGAGEPLSYDPMATVLPPPEVARDVLAAAEDGPPGSIRSTLRHARSLSKTNEHVMKRRSRILEPQTTPTSPLQETPDDPAGEYLMGEMRRTRDARAAVDEGGRSRSVDRGLFGSSDKRASARVGVSQAVASGDVRGGPAPATMPPTPRASRPADLGLARNRTSVASPLSVATGVESPRAEGGIDWALGAQEQSASPTPPGEQDLQRSTGTVRHADPASAPGSPSPEGREWSRPTRGDTMTTNKSSSTMSGEDVGTPLTSPSEGTSPAWTRSPTKNTSQHTLDFRSDPSLPALLSGASSVSADMDAEAELLSRPGVVGNQPSLLETTDSLTPPAHMKEPTSGFPLDQVFENAPAMASGPLSLHLGHDEQGRRVPSNDGDDDGEGSDDGVLLMAKSKRKSTAATPGSGGSATSTPGSGTPGSVRKGPFEARRRDTDMSTASTETARPVGGSVDDCDAPPFYYGDA